MAILGGLEPPVEDEGEESESEAKMDGCAGTRCCMALTANWAVCFPPESVDICGLFPWLVLLLM